MRRVIILLMDSFGIGASADAEQYGDTGANTFAHIVQACAKQQADQKGIRQGALKIPNLLRWGLKEAAQLSSKESLPQLPDADPLVAAYGFAKEISHGKDTPSGHWEMTGVPVLFDWGYFPYTQPCFPQQFTDELIKQAQLPGLLGNQHASGTEIIQQLGEQHQQTGKPIIYTSADSVVQIAAHEQSFGLDNLYRICQIARKLVDDYQIGRVIARPFIGENKNFVRTANRRDYTTPPHEKTLLDDLVAAKHQVIAIGKVADIFAQRGVTQTIKAANNMDLFDATLQALQQAEDNTLIFTNFVDFDSSYGHRRDVAGYANALEQFDARLPELEKHCQPGDLVIISADHGCDPTRPGSDHTREHIPVLLYNKTMPAFSLGARETFADIGQSIASYFELAPLKYGQSFLPKELIKQHHD